MTKIALGGIIPADMAGLEIEQDVNSHLSAEEMRAQELGKRVAPFLTRFNPHDRLVEILPESSTTIYDPDWVKYMSSFTLSERRTVSRAFHWMVSYANLQVYRTMFHQGTQNFTPQQELQTLEDAGKFDFQITKVYRIDRKSALLIREAFRQFDVPHAE